MILPEKVAGSNVFVGGYSTIPFADEIWRRVILQGEPSRKVADSLGMPYYSVGRVLACCRRLGKPPSQERFCVMLLNRFDVSDEDIAEAFGRTVKWVEDVRRRKAEIREREFLPAWNEFLDEGFAATDPSPFEIAQACEAIRSQWIDGREGRYPKEERDEPSVP